MRFKITPRRRVGAQLAGCLPQAQIHLGGNVVRQPAGDRQCRPGEAAAHLIVFIRGQMAEQVQAGHAGGDGGDEQRHQVGERIGQRLEQCHAIGLAGIGALHRFGLRLKGRVQPIRLR